MSDHIFRETAEGLEFVGDFEAVYSEKADPWGQSGISGEMASYYRASRARLSAALEGRRLGAVGGGLEIGCGHGYALPALQKAFGGHWAGLDISEAAIQNAKRLHPSFTFYAGDITKKPFPPSYLARWSAVILSECLWYVLERMDDAVIGATRLCRPGGLVCVSQAFLKGEQRYGAEIANGFHGTLRLFQDRYPSLALIEANYDDSGQHAHHHGLMIFRKVANNAQ